MKFITTLLLNMLLCFAAGLYFPWWSIAPVCFAVSFLIPQKYGWSALSGFFSVSLLWFAISFWLSFRNKHMLAAKISMLLFQVESPFLLVLVTAFTGGIIAGFASLSGALLRGKSVK